MPANTAPIFTLTPNIGRAQITTTYAQTKSDGTSSGTSADIMVKAFTAGANGSYVDKVRFNSVGTASTTSVATTLRVYLSTIASPGATIGGTDTFLLVDIATAAATTSSTTAASTQYEINIGIAIPSGTYIHVSQAVAQTTNQFWQAAVIGGDY